MANIANNNDTNRQKKAVPYATTADLNLTEEV